MTTTAFDHLASDYDVAFTATQLGGVLRSMVWDELEEALQANATITGQPTMRAVVQDTYGPAEVLQLREIARPTPAGDQVLVRVHAAGLDRGVWHVMAGLPYLIRLVGFGVRKPKVRVRGMDVAGRV